MKKNTLLLLVIAVGVIILYLAIGGGLKRDVTKTADDADFYADQQLAAQAGCSPSTTPKITNIIASGVTSSSAVVTWTTNMLANSEIKFWTAPQTASSVSWLPVIDTAGTLTHSYALSGLSPSKTYSYRVRSSAVPAGCRATSSTKTFVTLAGGGSTTAPTTPTGFTATVNSCTSATLSWIAPATATGYEVYGPNSACSVNGSAGYCGSTSGTSLTLSNLLASTTYSGSSGANAGFTVLAYNSAGYSASAARLTVATPACGSTDTVAPTTTTAAPSGSWATTNVARTLTCTDNAGGSGCAASYWQFVASTAACPAVGATSYSSGTSASTTSNGSWKLCFYSRDNANNTESPAKELSPFQLDSAAPTVSMTAPTAGQSLSGTAATLSATASDALSGVASVAFKIDGVTVGTDTTSPYSYSWNTTTIANGTHSFTATATDVAGNATTSAAVSATVSNSSVPATPTGLSVSTLTCDANGKVNTTLSWTASSGATSYEVYGPSSATSCPSGTCGVPTTNSLAISGLTANTTFSGSTGANAGFTVLARNASGYSGAATRLTVTTPSCSANAAPTITITGPTSATTYATSTSTITLAGTASDDTSVASVTWRNQTTGTIGTATGTTSWTTSAITLASGANTLVVTATDGAGLTSTDTITVTYSATTNQAPVVTITSPTSATTYATSINVVVLGGTATDDVGVSSVSYTNQTTGFTATAVGTGSWTTANIPLYAGANTIVVTATDTGGLTSTDSIVVTFSSVVAAAWPASASGAEIGTGLTTGYEPSGAFWNPADQMLYFVSDGGTITRMDQNGGNVTNWNVGGNLEGIAGTSSANVATMNYLYVVDENTSTLKEFSPWNGAYTGKTWSLANVPTDVPNNNGIEGITFVPNGLHPYNSLTTGVVLYVSSQSTGKVYVLDINLAASGTTPSVIGTITPSLITTGSNDISDLYYAAATNKLFVLYDTNNAVHEMRPNGLFVNEYKTPVVSATGEEAITTIPTCSATNTSIVLGYDDGGTTHHLYKYTSYPQPCTDTTAPAITALAAAPAATSATITWTTNETADSTIEYGIGGYTYTAADVALKTSGHSIVITGLSGGSYQYRVKSKDEAGNVSGYTTGSFIIGSTSTVWEPDHTVVAIMENTTSNQLTTTTAPYILNTLRPQGRYFSNFYGVISSGVGTAHVSQTQYLHLFSGSNQSWTSNNCLTSTLTSQNLGAELNAIGKSWAWYSEGLPSAGSTTCVSGRYYRKHNPTPNWQGTGTNQFSGTTYNLPYTSFPTNYANLPKVSFITPDICNDMHDTCSGPTRFNQGDTWLQNNMASYIAWAKNNNSLFVLYFDESDPGGAASDRFYVLMIGPSAHVAPGSTDSTTYNHYSMLRFIEDAYGTLTHAGGAATATQITLP